MSTLSKEIYEHLTEKIIPFWVNLKDDEFGGYYGYMDYDLALEKKAVKGCILNSRILWFFSNAYMFLKDYDGPFEDGEEKTAEKTAANLEKNRALAQGMLENANHAYDFMVSHCADDEFGGVLWSLKYNGEIFDDTKHTYNQAFSIYALSSYFDATGNRDALDRAYAIASVIEGVCTDEIGYLEAFNRNFTPASNEKLSENGVMADKTMNTLLHVFEAYTELLRVSKKYGIKASSIERRYFAKQGAAAEIRSCDAEYIEERLKFMMNLISDKIYNPELHRQEVFFDRYYNSILDLHSYGHDIETSWLIDRGCQVLGDEMLTEKMGAITRELAKKIYDRAYVNHSLLNECEKGVDNTHRIWWVQAETVVGFYNACQVAQKNADPYAEKYREAVYDVWNFIREKLTDPRNGSEWYWELDENLQPIKKRPIVEPWKCPYHNGRMCIEIIRREDGV